MPGDYSRKTFDHKKHYSGVLMQQGRVQLDADGNEEVNIRLYRTETEAQDVIGLCGVPKNSDGFKIGVTPDGSDLTVSPGRIYVDGILCELESKTTYGTQPDLPNPEFTVALASPPLSPPASPPTSPVEGAQLVLKDGIYIVYLAVSQREITALDDPCIREVALGGPDTTTRLKNVWQVKLLPVATEDTSPPSAVVTCKTPFPEWNELIGASTGKLNARTRISEDEENPCLLPPTAGYSRLENQLYRVVIHKGGKTPAEARFKWSRDNATVETTIEKLDGKDVLVSDVGKDEVLGFAGGQWVEIIERESELKNAPHPLVQIEAIEPETRTITLKTSAAAFAKKKGLKLRRWDQSENAAEDGVKITADWLNLEGGIEVQFSDGSYRPGDYWLIPARTATGEIEWPPFEIPNTAPIAQPPAGIRHHFCRLALVEARSLSSPPASPPTAGLTVIEDCREQFPPLTGICAEDVCFDNSVCNLDGAETVQQALDILCRRTGDRQPGIHVERILLAPPGNELLNDTEISVEQFANGLQIICDAIIEPDSVRDRPTCVVTLEMPFPFNIADLQLWSDGNERIGVIGFQPLVLAARTATKDRFISWKPIEETAKWLTTRLFARMKASDRGDRVLARLTLHGNFIWAHNDPKLYLDGDVFGIRKEGATNPTLLRFPSGDGLRGGNLEMWFYLVQKLVLRIDSVNFITSFAGVISILEVNNFPLEPAARVAFTREARANVIRVTFNRAVSSEGLGPNIRLEIIDPNTGERRRLSGEVRIISDDNKSVQFSLPSQSTINVSGQYELTVLGTEAQDAPPVRARDDGTVLDGDFDGEPGGDFKLLFTVLD